MDSLNPERDARVRFEEKEHKYYVDCRMVTYSVTQLIHKYFSDFDGDTAARRMLSNPNFFTTAKNPNYPTYWKLVTPELIRDDLDAAVKIITDYWGVNKDEASADGTAMHQSIEDFIVKGTPLPDTVELGYFRDFHNDQLNAGYISCRSEQIVFDEGYDLAGSADMLYTRPEWLLEKPLKVVLADWKRSKEIKLRPFSAKSVGKGICDHLPDCNYFHYTLQLNLYKLLLEKHYGVIIVSMVMAVFHPNNPGYIAYDIGLKTRTARRICERRGL
jgi:hypothetical protein